MASTLTAGRVPLNGREVKGLFTFGDDGLPAVFSAERYRDLGNGESLLTTFTGRTSDSRYRRVAGAAHDGAAWVIDEKEIEYVRFSVERIEFDRADVLTTEGTAGTRKKRRLF